MSFPFTKLALLLLLLLSHISRVRLCATHRRQPTRLLCRWDSPGKNTGVGCHFLLQNYNIGLPQLLVKQKIIIEITIQDYVYNIRYYYILCYIFL